jgi:CRP-like cAMP-binding protein
VSGYLIVTAITECKVWALDRSAFRLAMVKAGMQKIKDRLTFLRSVPLLKGLDAASLGRIADCLEVVG